MMIVVSNRQHTLTISSAATLGLRLLGTHGRSPRTGRRALLLVTVTGSGLATMKLCLGHGPPTVAF
jgi:hypothetical protein